MLNDQTIVHLQDGGHRCEQQELWCAVLTCAMNDAAGHVLAITGGTRSRDSVRKLIESQAKSWIGSRDFYYVCDLAGINPNAVLSAWERGVFPLKGGRGRYVHPMHGRATA